MSEGQVAVAYVGADRQFVQALPLHPGLTVGGAIAQSGVLARCPEIDLAVNKVGIHGKVVKLEQVLGDGDRVEIYRPLIADPRAARQQRGSVARLQSDGA